MTDKDLMPYDGRERRAGPGLVDVMQKTLQDGCDQHGRSYAHFLPFSVRLEMDDSTAVDDVKHLNQMLKVLDLGPAKELVIGKDEKLPSQVVISFLTSMVAQIATLQGRVLIIGHYAGHSTVIGGQLYLGASEKLARQEFSFLETFGNIIGQIAIIPQEGLSETDVVLIIDSCQSGAASETQSADLIKFGPAWRAHELENLDRTIEIIAAVGTEQLAKGDRPGSQSRQQQTFTCQLANMVARMRGPKRRFISFPEIVARMQESKSGLMKVVARLPEYHRILGDVPIRIRVTSGEADLPHQRTRSDHLCQSSAESWHSAESSLQTPLSIYAVFKIHMDIDNPQSDEMREFLEWIQLAPGALQPRLISCFVAESVELMLIAPWQTWLQLKHHKDVSLISQTRGQELFPEIAALRYTLQPQSSQPLQQRQQRQQPQSPSTGQSTNPPHREPGLRQQGGMREEIVPPRGSGTGSGRSGFEGGESTSSGGNISR